MFRRFSYVFILLLLIITLTGCFDQMEIDRINFPVALGIDFDEANNKIKVYAQISTTSSSSGGQEQTSKTFKVLEGQGDTLLSAMDNTADRGEQNISWKHITVVIITNEMAEHGIHNDLDLLCRFQQIHMNAYLMFTDGDLRDVLESTPKVQSSLSSPLDAIRLIGQQSADTKVVTIRDFVIAYLSDGREPIIPKISIMKGEKKEISIDYIGLGVFKLDKLVGELNEDETGGALSIYGMKNINSIAIPYSEDGKNKRLTISSISTKAEITPSIQRNIPSISINLEVEYNIGQSSIPIAINTMEVERIDKIVGEYIKNDAETSIRKSQKEFNSDIFGFGEKIYRKYPKYWLKNKEKWTDIFPNITINVEVNASLKNTGELLNSLKHLERAE